MDRNTIIAIVLSVIVITVGMGIQTAFFTPEMAIPAEEAAIESAGDGVLPSASGADISPAGTDPDPSPFEVEAGSYIITFDPRGASVSSIKLSEHYDNGEPVELLFRDPDDENAFMLYAGGNQSDPIDAVFSHTETVSSEGIHIISFTRDFTSSDGSPFTITKQYAVPDNGEYMIQLAVTFSTPDGSPIPLNLDNEMYSISVGPQIGPAFESMSSNYDYRRVSVRYDDKNRSEARFSDGIFVSDEDETVDWISLAGKYFAFILIPETDGTISSAEAIQTTNETGVPQEDIIYLNRAATSESSVRDMYSLYAGPKVKSSLSIYDDGESVFNSRDHELTQIIDGSWLTWLENILNWILQLFYKVIPNYGVAIILLTILIKLLLQPLAKRGMDSTAKMSALTPKINEIKEKYPDDPEAQNAAMAKLYKEEKINPMGSCLPMLIQFPIFIALYGLLNTNFDLRGSMFIPGWIPDLSIPDTIFTLPFSLPFLGSQIHLLPILYCISMIFSMKITQSGSQAGAQQGMMAFMTYGMPIIFFFIMYNAPSGLRLYWSTVNVISIGQQIFVNRKKKGIYAEEIAERDAEKQAKKEAKRKNRRK